MLQFLGISLIANLLLSLKLSRIRQGRGSEKEAVRARDEFISIASHELRTPLTSLKMEIQLLSKAMLDGDTRLTPRIPGLLEDADRQVDKINRLVMDMLDVSRIARLSLKLETIEFDLCELVRELLSRLAPRFREHGCELTLETVGPVQMSGDRFRIEQVLTNLVMNALRYGAGKPIEIQVCGNDASGVITVHDHGIGIASADQERIFDRFERARSSKNMGGGLGLGLYIAKHIVEAHGGRIRVKSKLGEGATFEVVVPTRMAKAA